MALVGHRDAVDGVVWIALGDGAAAVPSLGTTASIALESHRDALHGVRGFAAGDDLAAVVGRVAKADDLFGHDIPSEIKCAEHRAVVGHT